MKMFIHALAKRFGYRISRIAQPGCGEPFPDMQRLLTGIERPIIFDVGAHHGNVARRFRSMFPSAEIYAFEPFPESFGRLRANTDSDANIHAFNMGLSDRRGSQAFHSNQFSETNSLLATDTKGSSTWGTGLLELKNVIEARFETLDAVVARENIARIDMLKLDVQGAESLVMAGARAACKQGLIGVVYSEFITQPTYAGQKRLDEALATFYDNGFDLYNVYNMSHTGDGRLRQFDALFTRRSS